MEEKRPWLALAVLFGLNTAIILLFQTLLQA